MYVCIYVKSNIKAIVVATQQDPGSVWSKC